MFISFLFHTYGHIINLYNIIPIIIYVSLFGLLVYSGGGGDPQLPPSGLDTAGGVMHGNGGEGALPPSSPPLHQVCFIYFK